MLKIDLNVIKNIYLSNIYLNIYSILCKNKTIEILKNNVGKAVKCLTQGNFIKATLKNLN